MIWSENEIFHKQHSISYTIMFQVFKQFSSTEMKACITNIIMFKCKFDKNSLYFLLHWLAGNIPNKNLFISDRGGLSVNLLVSIYSSLNSFLESSTITILLFWVLLHQKSSYYFFPSFSWTGVLEFSVGPFGFLRGSTFYSACWKCRFCLMQGGSTDSTVSMS